MNPLRRPGMNPNLHAMVPLLQLFFGSGAVLLLLFLVVGCATHNRGPEAQTQQVQEVRTVHLQESLKVCEQVADHFSDYGFNLLDHHHYFGLCMVEQGYAKIQGRYILTHDGQIAMELRVADHRLNITSTVMGELGHGQGSKRRQRE